VGVTDGDRLLLTKYAPNHSAHRRYALVAGYTEIGESFEDTVRREVLEEVGLQVKNIRYFASQPWSFSGALLAGFLGGLIVLLLNKIFAKAPDFLQRMMPVLIIPLFGITLMALVMYAINPVTTAIGVPAAPTAARALSETNLPTTIMSAVCSSFVISCEKTRGIASLIMVGSMGPFNISIGAFCLFFAKIDMKVTS
jgi:fructose-specific phosphotransferase system IIC component